MKVGETYLWSWDGRDGEEKWMLRVVTKVHRRDRLRCRATCVAASDPRWLGPQRGDSSRSPDRWLDQGDLGVLLSE